MPINHIIPPQQEQHNLAVTISAT